MSLSSIFWKRRPEQRHGRGSGHSFPNPNQPSILNPTTGGATFALIRALATVRIQEAVIPGRSRCHACSGSAPDDLGLTEMDLITARRPPHRPERSEQARPGCRPEGPVTFSKRQISPKGDQQPLSFLPVFSPVREVVEVGSDTTACDTHRRMRWGISFADMLVALRRMSLRPLLSKEAGGGPLPEKCPEPMLHLLEATT